MNKKSIPAIAINNDCMKMTGKVAEVKFPKRTNDRVESRFWDRKVRSNFNEFASQKCVPNTNPNRVI